MKKMRRLNIQLPHELKGKLDALRHQGYTASGFIRHLLEERFKHPPVTGREGR